MTRVLTFVVAAVLAVPALAMDSRLGGPDADWPEFQFDADLFVQAEVLICLDTDANPGFSDPTPIYYAAFSAAGASPIATCAVEVSGGTINFPPDLTGDSYPIVVVLTGENWWSAPQNIDAADEAVLADYLDSGGNLLIVGQDYMYGAHPTMGTCTGFPFDYLGLDRCYQDVLWGPNTADITGSIEGIFEGESATLDSANVFISNPFFPDCADPTPTAQYGFYYVDAGRNGVVIYNETDTFKTVWSGVELAGASPEVFEGIIETIYDWFVGTTPVENRSWGRIKALYGR
ncbi:MAG: hypothetical protein U9Q95_04065 [Candidatus Eisenbacteria bacterium]|nr:hypothetical protein [Candidatus Eisenbacteria bacterium]